MPAPKSTRQWPLGTFKLAFWRADDLPGRVRHPGSGRPHLINRRLMFFVLVTSPALQTRARFRKDIHVGSSNRHGRDAGHANRDYPKASTFADELPRAKSGYAGACAEIQG